MRKIVLSFLICLLLTFSMIGIAPSASANVKGAEAVLAQMEVVGKSLNSLVANIWQQKKNTQIGIDDPVETGQLYYLPGKNGAVKLRIDISNPTKKTVIITGDQLKFYQPTIEQMLVTSLKSTKNSQSFGSLAITFGSVSAIRANYDVKFVKDEKIQGEDASLLHLTPKAGGPYKSIDIWISQSSWLPIQENLVEGNDDVTIIKLSNLKKNTSFDVKALIDNFAPPKSTKIVKG
ncbi:MAG: outer-membrane lipoprotein carrier protein LolA [Blastocatellia bacterium]